MNQTWNLKKSERELFEQKKEKISPKKVELWHFPLPLLLFWVKELFKTFQRLYSPRDLKKGGACLFESFQMSNPTRRRWDLEGPSTSSFIPHHLDQSGCAGVGAGYLNWFTCNPSQPPFRPLKGSMVQEGISSQPKQAPENISLQRKVTKGKIYILMPPSASIILCSICPTQLIMIPTKDD